MKLVPKKIIVGISLSLALSFAFMPQLFAHEGDHSNIIISQTTETTETTNTTRGVRPESQKKTETTDDSSVDNEAVKRDNPRGEERRELAREKLDEKKKAVCENRQSAVNRSMDNVVQRSKNHFERITKVYDLTTKFYVDKGLSVSNYEALVATVETAKTTAEAANQELTAVPEFTCNSDGPKADVQAFLNKRLDKVEAFGAYRDAVKNLVKAVKEAALAAATTSTEPAADTTTGGTN